MLQLQPSRICFLLDGSKTIACRRIGLIICHVHHLRTAGVDRVVRNQARCFEFINMNRADELMRQGNTGGNNRVAFGNRLVDLGVLIGGDQDDATHT